MKCHEMPDCAVFYVSAGSEGIDGSLDEPPESDLLIPTFRRTTVADSAGSPGLVQPPDWPPLIKQV